MADTSSKQKKNAHIKDLLLLLAIPMGVIALAAAVIYIPRLSANPAYDFIYATCSDYRCGTGYTVEGGKLIQKEYDSAGDYMGSPAAATIYRYDIRQSSARAIPYEEAQSLRLNPSSKSPDGYTLAKESSNGGFLFWSDYSQDWYVQDGAKKKEVKLTPENSYYADNITFLGWVEK